MKTILAFILAAWMAVWPCYANPLLMLAGKPPAAPTGPAAIVSSPSAGSLRNNYSGAIGFGFVATSAVNVTELGRWMWSGNSGTSTVRLFDITGNATAVAANITLTGATVGDYVWSSTPAQGSFPYTLIVGRTYVLTCTETSGGNQWTEKSAITITSVGTLVGSVVGQSTAPTADSQGYSRPNFRYE